MSVASRIASANFQPLVKPEVEEEELAFPARDPGFLSNFPDLFRENGVYLNSSYPRAPRLPGRLQRAKGKPFHEMDYVRVFVRRTNIGDTLSKLYAE